MGKRPSSDHAMLKDIWDRMYCREAVIRLDEAKWWAERMGSWTNETAGRVNALEQAAGGGK